MTGSEMRQLRTACGPIMTLREMARRLKLSSAYVSDLELNRRPWTERRQAQYLAAIEEHKAEFAEAPPPAPIPAIDYTVLAP